MIDKLKEKLQVALDNQDGFAIAIIVSRIEQLGFNVTVNNDEKPVIITSIN